MKAVVGLRVVRGPDWEWGEQDGGEGHLGTVVEIGEPISTSGGRAVVVQWDSGNRCKYRCGVGGKFDLRVFDPAPAAMKDHKWDGALCSSCSNDDDPGYIGITWDCARCHTYSLCTACYMSGKHNSEHEFIRYDGIHSARKRVQPRVISDRNEAWGISTGAIVARGHDWPSEKKDNNHPPVTITGEVMSVVHDSKERCEVNVKWLSNNSITKCQVGKGGKVDLKYVSPASMGYYYPSHLPILGAPDVPIGAEIISSGDFVRVELEADILRIMQEEHGGWNEGMKSIIGQFGVVHSVNDAGDLSIYFIGRKWVLNPNAVINLDRPSLVTDDIVRVSDDKEAVMKLQCGVGTTWSDEMVESLGQVGQISGSDELGMVSVLVKRKLWIFNPLCLTRIEDVDQELLEKEEVKDDPVLLQKVQTLLAEGNSDVVAYAAKLGDEYVIREYLKTSPNEVNKLVEGKSPLHFAAQGGHVPAMNALLDFQPDVNVTDEFGHTPLFYCLRCLKMRTSADLIKLLLNAGANPNLKNVAGETVLMLAAVNGVHAAVKVLIENPQTDISIEDLEGNTALHQTVIAQQPYSTRQLVKVGADPRRVNSNLETPLHSATKGRFFSGIESMLEFHPELTNLEDDDGCTPLQIATLQDHNCDVATYIMQQPQCNLDTQTPVSKRTPLHAAVIKGNCVLVERLVGFGADMNIQDHENATPLHIATVIASQSIKIFADTRPFTPSERTPELNKINQSLGKAVNVHTVFACFLVREGANTTLKNILGQNPLQGCNVSTLALISRFTTSGAGSFHGSLKNNPAKMLATIPSTVNDNCESPQLCDLCDDPVDIKFLPCGHVVICKLCAKRATKCLACQKPITDIIKV